MTAVRSVTRLQDQDDLTAVPASADDAKPVIWHLPTSKFAFGAPERPKQTIVCIGDSITDANFNTINAAARGYWTQAQIRLRHRFTLLASSGVSGNTTAQVLARLQTDALSRGPGYVLVAAGGNDVASAVSAATIQANLQAIYEACRAQGVLVIATTIIPTVNADTAAEKLVMQTVNNWIRGYARSTPGILFCDWHTAVADPTTGDPATGMAFDGVHPSQKGAYYLGLALYNAIEGVTTLADLLPFTNAEAGLTLPNPRMVGNTAGLASSTTLAANGGAPTLTPSKVARTDGIQGEWQQIVASGGTDNFRLQQQSTTNVGGGNVSVGDYVFAVAEVEIDAGATMVGVAGEVPVGLTLINQDAGGASITDMYAPTGDGTYPGAVPSGRMCLRTPNYLLPAGSSRLFIRTVFAVNGTVRLGRMQVYKV